jgi:hypothetical protein
MRPHQLELHLETDPALALRQFHEQIGQGDVDGSSRLDHSGIRCERRAGDIRRANVSRYASQFQLRSLAWLKETERIVNPLGRNAFRLAQRKRVEIRLSDRRAHVSHHIEIYGQVGGDDAGAQLKNPQFEQLLVRGGILTMLDDAGHGAVIYEWSRNRRTARRCGVRNHVDVGLSSFRPYP